MLNQTVVFMFVHERAGGTAGVVRALTTGCRFVSFLWQSGQEDEEDDVAVDDQDFLNEDELAELRRDEENIKKEVCVLLSEQYTHRRKEVELEL